MLFSPCRLFLCVRLSAVRLAPRRNPRDTAVVPAGPSPSSSSTSSTSTSTSTSTTISSSATLPSSSTFSSLDHHRRLSAEAAALRPGAGHAAAEQIERRRQRWTVAESEFDAGITERLFPEISRLPALHELHYGDAVMREIDGALYFAARRGEDDEEGGEGEGEREGKEGAAVRGTLSDAEFLEFESDAMDHAPRTSDEPSMDSTPIEPVNNSTDGPAAVAHGILTPSFVPSDGVVRYEPMPAGDAACLLTFAMRLRQQSAKDLSAPLRAKLRSQSLSLEDVMQYMDTAPAPVIGFSADLPPRESPAFVFVLYTENVSLHNAIGHIAALFGIPQRSFMTRTAGSKMSCASVLCAVEANRVCREHLLLLNTMRHPGFVLRVGSIRACPGASRDIFAELARWQPVHEVELLLRRVTCGSSGGGGPDEIMHRLRAARDVGAVFFCANREASLVRAATDVLHGFSKSALLNALHRRRAPLAMRLFMARPNRITAARALRVAADPTVRYILRQFIRVNGDWAKTLARVPYAWRRRWLSALRCAVWNQMASRRMRRGGRRVIVGDIVLRETFRRDAHRRGITTVKAEHVMLVRSAEEAAACSVEDIFIPFLRGVYPTELFAPDETAHPIMTRANMLALLREAHAPQLLLGMSEASRTLLDIRSDVSPLLFRRFVARPLEMRFTLLEDKPPVGAMHFDAARVLSNDRLDQQHTSGLPRSEETQKETQNEIHNKTQGECHAEIHTVPCVSRPSLVSQAAVLERTTLGARLTSGVLAEEFFTPAAREDYATLAHVCRRANSGSSGSSAFVLAAPQAKSSALHTVDRVYNVHVHAVVRHGSAALAQLLREYFLLNGVEREEDSALQHKVHRVRRELDAETSRITAPHFCTACFCRSHDSRDECAEFQRKRRVQMRRERRVESVAALAATATATATAAEELEGASTAGNGTDMKIANGSREILWDVQLRRRAATQKWGIRISAGLRLTGMDDPSVIASGSLQSSSSSLYSLSSSLSSSSSSSSLSSSSSSSSSDSSSGAASCSPAQPLCEKNSYPFRTTADLSAALDPSSALSQFISAATGGVAVALGSPLPHLSDAIALRTESHTTDPQSQSQSQSQSQVLRRCAWVLSAVNGVFVRNRRDVAAVFVRCGEDREVTLRFSAALPTLALSPGDSNSKNNKNNENNENDNNRLPLLLSVELTRERVPGDQRGWGIRLGERTLSVQNLSTVLNSSESAVRPPLEASPDMDGRYAVRRVNNIQVGAMEDVVRLLRQSGLGEDESGRKTLRLELELLSTDLQSSRTTASVVSSTESTRTNATNTHVTYADDTNNPSDHSDGFVLNEKAVKRVTQITGSPMCAQEESSPPLPPPPLPLPCSPQCKPLTPEQQRKGLITLVVNRCPGAPIGRWGLRVQRDSVRLLRVQHNHHFTFQVYAAKQSQAVRVTDTLRYNSIRRRRTSSSFSSSNSSNSSNSSSSSAAFASQFLYMIIGVNGQRVENAYELRKALATAPAADALVLQLRQHRLAQVAVRVERTSCGDAEPFGLRVARDMSIVSIAHGSPMARGIAAATHAHCSLRGFISPAPGMTNAWQFDLDEDLSNEKAVVTSGEAHAYWDMTDGVAVMKAYNAGSKEDDGGNKEENGGNKKDDGSERFAWRLVYAARAGPLRTPEDVARAFGAEVKDETVFVQQCVIDENDE